MVMRAPTSSGRNLLPKIVGRLDQSTPLPFQSGLESQLEEVHMDQLIEEIQIIVHNFFNRKNQIKKAWS